MSVTGLPKISVGSRNFTSSFQRIPPAQKYTFGVLLSMNKCCKVVSPRVHFYWHNICEHFLYAFQIFTWAFTLTEFFDGCEYFIFVELACDGFTVFARNFYNRTTRPTGPLVLKNMAYWPSSTIRLMESMFFFVAATTGLPGRLLTLRLHLFPWIFLPENFIFVISRRKYILWVLIRSASLEVLMSTHNICFLGEIRNIFISHNLDIFLRAMQSLS